MKPIIKWAGGKTQLLDEIFRKVPNKYNRYYEPFFGGGAVFFKLNPPRASINDCNIKLMNMYEVIKREPKELISILDIHQNKHKEEYFYKIRDKFNENILNNEYSVEDAADFIYLNKMCYNGLYRVNSDGKFNVPSSRKEKCVLYDKKNIYEVSNALSKVTIRSVDFEKACYRARKGDFVFFDSPYYDTFDSYQKNGFSEDDHKRLAKLFKKLSDKGVFCMLTNSDTEFIRELYSEYEIKLVEVKRMINCDGKKRTGTELIITNYEVENE